MKIPFFDLKRQYQSIGEEIENAVVEVLRSGSYIGGATVSEFESAMAEYLGVRHVITCGNGTDALRLALQAAGVGRDDEVITTAFSFYATCEAITELGAVPVFVDVNSHDYNMNPDLIKSRITSRTKAILPVHIFGLPANMDEINSVAKEHGLVVIEDACQAIGASYHDNKTGTLGDMGCFSFYPTKNLGGCGDGGMVTTNSDSYAKLIKALKAHGAGDAGREAYELIHGEKIKEDGSSSGRGKGSYDPYKYYNYLSGWNSRLDAVQAAVLSVKLNYIDQWNRRRKMIADTYQAALAGSGFSLPITEDDARISSCHQYALYATSDREELQSFLRSKGIETGNFYPVPLHRQFVYRGTAVADSVCAVADELCKKTVCLPVFPELTDEEVGYISDCCVNFIKGR